MDFLNHRKGGMVWFSIRFFFFLFYRNCKRLREFEEIEILRQSCRGDREKQGGKLLRLLSGFCPRIWPPSVFILENIIHIQSKSEGGVYFSWNISP
jgi:hypothetical protein